MSRCGDVSCLGQCDGAPAVSINDHIYRERHHRAGRGAGAHRARRQRTSRDAGRTRKIVNLGSDPYAGAEHYGALRNLIASRDWDGVIAQLKASGLSGLGGAGFPTGMKWEAVRKERGPEKYVVCNADESEPGTIKDRFIMQQPAEPGDRRHDHRGPGYRRAKGHPLSPARVSGAGAYSARRDRALLRKKAFWARTCWVRASPSIWNCSSAPADTFAGKRAR